jgi:non-specific serine/threonine protein kinase
LDRAEAFAADELTCAQELQSAWGIALAFGMLASIAQHRGDHARAVSLHQQALTLLWELRDRAQVTFALRCIATTVIVDPGTAEFAARLWGAADALAEEIEEFVPPEHREELDRARAVIRAALGDEALARALAAGRTLPLAQAVSEALAFDPASLASADPADAPGAPGGLTPRELEVVRLIAAGRSNQEIADALFISHRTATTHVRNILTKLDLDSRTAIAAWAIRGGLA